MTKMHTLPQEDILCKEGQTRAFLRPYTKDWNNPESDSLHLEYSYNGKNWYSLNGNNGVWFGSSAYFGIYTLGRYISFASNN